jgi:hypothetical protein
VSDALADADTAWRQEVLRRVAHAKSAATDAPDILERFDDALLAVSSEQRLPLLLDLASRRPPQVFWPAFHEWWNLCDDTWIWRADLLRRLRRHHAREPGPHYLSGDDRTCFDGLPDCLEVYRGCSKARIRGLSWTTDRDVAASFAVGHRGIRVPEPVIASAVIPKHAIFAAITARGEGEIVIDPQALRCLKTGRP